VIFLTRVFYRSSVTQGGKKGGTPKQSLNMIYDKGGGGGKNFPFTERNSVEWERRKHNNGQFLTEKVGDFFSIIT